MTSEYHYDRGWTTDVAPYCEACREAFPCQPFLVEQVDTLTAERDRYREALESIANPYVHDAEAQTWIARAALGLDGEG